MTSRGEQTRTHLLDVAEQLMGERGVSAVSLREIRIAAGARNTAAIQFHFDDRQGLIDALTARHVPRIGEIQEQIYDRMVADGRAHDRRSLVEVLVRPCAEYLTRGPSARAWIKIMADLDSEPDLEINEMSTMAPPSALIVTKALLDDLVGWMPRMVAAERLNVLAHSTVQNCADRARLQDGPTSPRARVPEVVFVENLVDMRFGSLFAPVSPVITARSRAKNGAPTGRSTRH